MNYALLQGWVLDRVEDLVQFGVPRAEAECIMRAVEYGAISSEAKARSEDQFLLDFKRVGAVALAERYQRTPQAIRNKRNKILKSKSPLALTLAR